MNCGDPTIDGLLIHAATLRPLEEGTTGTAVSHLQDLLRGHGYNLLPDPRVAGYGSFGAQTCRAVIDYRERHGLPPGSSVDSDLLVDIIHRRADEAVLGPAYAPLVLDLPFTPILRFVWLTSLFETRGSFAATNLNTDGCGLSLGLLQWSQRSGQLHTLLSAFCTRAPEVWREIAGNTDVLECTSRPNGGLDAPGFATDPRYELTTDPWKSKIAMLAAQTALQKIQIELATEAYSAELKRLREYAASIRSERAIAFLLDLGNQFGCARVRQQYLAHAPGRNESAILTKLEDVFTDLAEARFRTSVRERREFFRNTNLLSDAPINS